MVAYSQELAEDFVPVLLDPRGKGSKPHPPDFIAYRLVFKNGRPVVIVLNCYHALTGLKQKLPPKERHDITPRLQRPSRGLIGRWYFRHVKNRFGHDVSNSFNEPHIIYYTPPEGLKSRLIYGVLWLLTSMMR